MVRSSSTKFVGSAHIPKQSVVDGDLFIGRDRVGRNKRAYRNFAQPSTLRPLWGSCVGVTGCGGGAGLDAETGGCGAGRRWAAVSSAGSHLGSLSIDGSSGTSRGRHTAVDARPSRCSRADRRRPVIEQVATMRDLAIGDPRPAVLQPDQSVFPPANRFRYFEGLSLFRLMSTTREKSHPPARFAVDVG